MKKIRIALAICVGIVLGALPPAETEAMPIDGGGCCVDCGSTTACGYCSASCGATSCKSGLC
jgi:hypothetical protein